MKCNVCGKEMRIESIRVESTVEKYTLKKSRQVTVHMCKNAACAKCGQKQEQKTLVWEGGE